MYFPVISAISVNISAQSTYVPPAIIEENEETITNNSDKKGKTKQVANEVDGALNTLTKSGNAAQEMAAAGSRAASLNDINFAEVNPKTNLLDKIATAFEIVNFVKREDKDPNHPISATHLYECLTDPSGGRCYDRGDLMNVTPVMKKQIEEGDFTYCEAYNLEPTRLSRGKFVPNDGVFTGTKKTEVSEELLCDIFTEEALTDTINKLEKMLDIQKQLI